MKNKLKSEHKRPLSHNPLLNFSQNEHFLYSNPKFMNDELWKRKFNLRNLHKKWSRKVQTNFLDIDIKFPISKKNSVKLISKQIHRSSSNPEFYDIIHGIQKKINSPFKQPQKFLEVKNQKFNNQPWNNCIQVDQKIYKNEILPEVKNNLNEHVISNDIKNIKITCSYYNNKYIERLKKIKILIDKEINETFEEMNKTGDKLYKIKLKKNKTYLIFQEMITKYIDIFNSIKNVRVFNNNYKPYEKLYIIYNYLKNNQALLKNSNNNDGKIDDYYFEIMKNDKILRLNDKNYQKYINDFLGINVTDDFNKNNTIVTTNNIKYLGRCKSAFLNENKKVCEVTNIFKKNALGNFKVTYYHPGTYYLWEKGTENEYHAWSCCMNEYKFAKGCCKKKERIVSVNYDSIV